MARRGSETGTTKRRQDAPPPPFHYESWITSVLDYLGRYPDIRADWEATGFLDSDGYPNHPTIGRWFSSLQSRGAALRGDVVYLPTRTDRHFFGTMGGKADPNDPIYKAGLAYMRSGEGKKAMTAPPPRDAKGSGA